jgi:polysaccharide pyruvyl transferase WcaK-like protein
MLINMFDTSIVSDNIGDEIIMDAVWRIVRELFPDATFVTTATHRFATPRELVSGRRADVSIVGGTNLLKPHMFYRGNWRITPADLLAWRNVVLLGVGWRHYSGKPDIATRAFLRAALSRTYLQSVRDEYTLNKLDGLLPNVVYTGCPTMWELTEQVCRRVSTGKARHAVFTVTYYHPAPEQDRAVFDLLKRHYDTVYIWAQQEGDVGYVQELGLDGFVWVDRTLAAYDALLDQADVDYVGTRLHGGIRALQRARRSAIIPVDNRATEIEKHTRLPIVRRSDPAGVEHWICNPGPTTLTMPWDDVMRWKQQFAHCTKQANAAERQQATFAAADCQV